MRVFIAADVFIACWEGDTSAQLFFENLELHKKSYFVTPATFQTIYSHLHAHGLTDMEVRRYLQSILTTRNVDVQTV